MFFALVTELFFHCCILVQLIPFTRSGRKKRSMLSWQPAEYPAPDDFANYTFHIHNEMSLSRGPNSNLCMNEAVALRRGRKSANNRDLQCVLRARTSFAVNVAARASPDNFPAHACVRDSRRLDLVMSTSAV